MTKLEQLFKTAVEKFGTEGAGAMVNISGGYDGTLATLPAARHGDLQRIYEKMLGSGLAIAQAKQDFAMLAQASTRMKSHDDADDDQPNAKSKPITIDASAVYRKWNTPNGRKLGDGL